MSQKPGVREYLGISLFWFALSFFWGAMLGIVLPDRVEQLMGPHNKDWALTLIVSMGAFMATSTQILFGALSDRSRHSMGRRRPFLIAGTLLTTAALFAFPAARTLAMLVGAYVAIQFCLNIANGPYQALIPDRIPFEYHGMASAYMGICTLLGRIGGPFAASQLLTRGHGGLFSLMVVFAVFLNAFMIVNVLLIRETTPAQSGPGMRDTLRNLFAVALRPYPSFVWLLMSRFGIMMGLYTVFFCLLYYIRDTLGHRDDAFTVFRNFMIFSTLTGILGTLPAGAISDRFSKKIVLYIANTIGMAAGITFTLAHELSVAYAAVAFFGLGYGAFQAVDWALACNLLPQQEPAKYMGVWSVSDTFPQIIAPLIAGPIAYVINLHVGSGMGYRVLMGLAMVYFALGTVAIHFIKERTRPTC